MISNVWIQTACMVLIIGFFIMGVLAYYRYNDEPPIPNVVKAASGALLFEQLVPQFGGPHPGPLFPGRRD